MWQCETGADPDTAWIARATIALRECREKGPEFGSVFGKLKTKEDKPTLAEILYPKILAMFESEIASSAKTRAWRWYPKFANWCSAWLAVGTSESGKKNQQSNSPNLSSEVIGPSGRRLERHRRRVSHPFGCETSHVRGFCGL